MESTEFIERMVSIIIPLYNAEEHLGYCLNSVISQTYHQIEVILVNDGSTDNSLSICQNYADIDKRISIITIENGGVSNARNVGLGAAKGEYIQFVDSDDVIAPTMTDMLLNRMEIYDADIVFCGMKVVDIDENFLRGNVKDVFSSRKIGKECVLRGRQFYKEFPRLLFDTVLLEGPCNKIYKNKIIKEYNIKFPLDISLGEDFLFNLNYFERGTKFVFLSEELYYYIQLNVNSLTRVYRDDLLSNKIRLLEAYKDFMDRTDAWTTEGEIWYANYCVGYFISILNSIFMHGTGLTEKEIKAQIEEVVNHDLFRETINKCRWIKEPWAWIKDCIRYSDIGMIYENGIKMCN